MLEATKRLIALRKKYASLRRGALTTLHAAGRVYAFARHQKDETVVVALNTGREPVILDLRVDRLISDGTRLVEEWTREEIVVAGRLCTWRANRAPRGNGMACRRSFISILTRSMHPSRCF